MRFSKKTILFLAMVALVAQASCTANARTQTQTRTLGVDRGAETNLTTTTVETSQATTGVDIGAAISAAVQASQGKILGALSALKPQELNTDDLLTKISQATPKPVTDWGTIIGGGGMTIMGLLLAWLKAKEKAKIEEDRDQIYDQHIEVCKQLPPKEQK